MEFTPIIIVHVATAAAALLSGGAVLALRKGNRLHRMLGRTWVLLMLATALISFGIRRNGEFSAIHILSVITIAGIGAALFAAWRGNIRAHRRAMGATYAGLVIAGVFTLLPDRRLGALLLHAVGFA